MRGRHHQWYRNDHWRHHHRSHDHREGNRGFLPHFPFDVYMSESAFSRIKPEPDDEEFTQALLERNQVLTATPDEQTSVSMHVTRVSNALYVLVLSPPSDIDIEEFRQVGSYKKGTMTIGNPVADLAVIFKSTPLKSTVAKLAEKLIEELKKTSPELEMMIEITQSGFQLVAMKSTVNILIGTRMSNIRKIQHDETREDYISTNHLQATLAAIRHTKWFEEHASHSSVKVMIRLLNDMKKRFEGFSGLTSWMIDLLAHHCVMSTKPGDVLPINKAFRRCLRILSSGFFLPGSAGIVDPCENNNLRVHTLMSLQEQDQVCYTSQTLLRVLSHGGFKKVIGIDDDTTIATYVTVHRNVVVQPGRKVYEKTSSERSNKNGGDTHEEESTVSN